MLSVRKYSGARSMRDYAKSLGTNPKPGETLSLLRLVSADVLQHNWQARGADVKVGPPVADVVSSAGRFSREYSGGRLSVAAATEEVQEDEAYEALVYIAGIECIRRGKDQAGGPNNEIYLVVTPIDASNIVVDASDENKNTVKSIETRTFGGVNGGDFIGLGLPVFQGRNPASLTLSLALWEEDEGNRTEAKEEVQKQVRKGAKTIALIAGLATGSPSLAGQLPLVDELAKGLAPAITSILGLADDHIGSGVKHLGYDDLRGNPPPVKQPAGIISTQTRGEPLAIGQGADTGEFKIHFYWETRRVTHFE